MRIGGKLLRKRCKQSKSSLLRGERFRFIDNGSNVLAVAHCDYVGCNREHLYKCNANGIVQSTTLDDRLGVHIILDVLPSIGIRPDVLLTDDEEKGESTARLFKPKKRYNWVFSFDRRGTGAVVYEYREMIPFATKYFGKVHDGTFSDITELSHLGVCGVNVGTGYENEHTEKSYANLRVTKRQVENFARFFRAWSDYEIPHEETDDTWNWTDNDEVINRWPDYPNENGNRIGYGIASDTDTDAEDMTDEQYRELIEAMENHYYDQHMRDIRS